ncbi:MAG TPA: SUMF1/EgtB/PvdO family nonheme iron enzyme [Kofleriaceae bacterium]|nr:SUMF1/EgtB/PvdO family nonheme iron enzyme [Kofleriaceae bacterium]
MSETRDIEPAPLPSAEEPRAAAGRRVIAAIGIDRYHHWRPLSNAESDARGAVALFRQLGFEDAVPPLLGEAATGRAIHALAADDLRALGTEDSLVLFYAGHGGTRRNHVSGEEIKTGYLIPVDASVSPDEAVTWIELESWLRAVALLPPKHILVILDACHSGIALSPVVRWRDSGTALRDLPLSTLRMRRSRRIITSALDDQVALDSGPVHGHSLFTGVLIEAFTGGLRPEGRRAISGSELGLYVQQRVEKYPRSRQTPDFGAFDLDERGEMVIPLASEGPELDDVLLPPPRRLPGPRRPPGSEDKPVRPPPEPSSWRVRAGVAAAGLAAIFGVVALATRGESPERPAVPQAPADASVPPTEAAPPPAEAPPKVGEAPSELSTPIKVPNSWVRIDPPPAPYPLGVADRAPPQHVGFRASRGIVTPSRPYDIQMHEVTWSELEPWLAARRERVDYPPWAADVGVRAGLPATGITWSMASAYCRSLGGELPTEEQWEYAARGAERRSHPWGNKSLDLQMTHAYAGADAVPRPVMESVQDRTPYKPRIYDLAGNVQEWTQDLWREDRPGGDESDVQVGQTTSRAIRGLPLGVPSPASLPPTSAAYRERLCATGPCVERTRKRLAYIGFRCVKPLDE